MNESGMSKKKNIENITDTLDSKLLRLLFHEETKHNKAFMSLIYRFIKYYRNSHKL